MGDFGLSKELKKEKTTSICGTIHYMAREVSLRAVGELIKAIPF